MRLSPRLPASNVNVSKASPLRDFAVMLGTIVLCLVAVYVALGLAVDVVAPHVSPELEDRIAGRISDRHPLLRGAAPASDGLRALAERTALAMEAERGTPEVSVADLDMVNAFALPGGRIVLTRGMLDAVGSENELVFILGHEIGHIEARDHLRGMGRGLVLAAMAELVLGDSGGLTDLLTGTLALTDRGFSRAQEMRADERGLGAMIAVYGHAGGLREAFASLGDEDYGALAELALTHPENSKRLAALEAVIAEKGYSTRDPKPLSAPLR